MRVLLLAVGRMKQGPERELLGRYMDRATGLARSVGLTGLAMREIDMGGRLILLMYSLLRMTLLNELSVLLAKKR